MKRLRVVELKLEPEEIVAREKRAGGEFVKAGAGVNSPPQRRIRRRGGEFASGRRGGESAHPASDVAAA
eukprot:41652-Prorocentrum_minimum.AAC.1